MGHLFLVANSIVRSVELGNAPSEIRTYLESEKWNDFEKLVLRETNSRNMKALGTSKHPNNSKNQSVLNDGDSPADQVNFLN